MSNAAREQLDDAQHMYLQMLLDSGCKLLFRTFLFGKYYVWMKDAQGAIFLERIPDPKENTDA